MTGRQTACKLRVCATSNPLKLRAFPACIKMYEALPGQDEVDCWGGGRVAKGAGGGEQQVFSTA